MQGVVDQVPGAPDTRGASLSSVSASAADPLGTVVVQGGGTSVLAHLHASPSILPVKPPTPAVIPTR